MAYRAKDYNEIDWNEIFIADCSSPSGLIWKKNFGQRARCGKTAGSINTAKSSGRQCFQVKYNKTSWLVHRILWIIWNGSVNPDLDIDHIDGNSLNNSVENLRLVSTAVNSRNQKQRIDNSSGFTGVSFMINQDGNTYAKAQWYDLNRKHKVKCFSCGKLGLLPAFAAACSYREEIIKELNSIGACYSDRHGFILNDETKS